MANRNILLSINSQGVQTDEYLENLCLYDSDVSQDKEILSKNPFVKFVESPCFMHVMVNPDNMQLESKQMFVETYNGDVFSRVNSKDNKNKMFYILPYSKYEISEKGPTMYNPMNFMPIDVKFTRLAEVKLTDRQVEEIIFEHEYINDDILNDDVKNELFYFKNFYGNDPLGPSSFSSFETVTKRLMSTKQHRLSEKAYKVYSTLVERTRLPDEETFNRWLKRLEKIGSTNNDYMYVLIRR